MPEEPQKPAQKEVTIIGLSEELFGTLWLGLQTFKYEPQPNVTRQWAALPKEIDDAFDKFCYAMRKSGRPISKATVYGWIIKNWLKGSPFDEPKLAETAAKLKLMMKEAQETPFKNRREIDELIKKHEEQIAFLRKAITMHEQYISFLRTLKT